MKKVKRVLALLLSVCMLAGMTVNAAAVSDQSNQTSATAADSDFDKVLHLDNGRKYFTKKWIVALINEMSAAGYNQLQLAFGNDGMRFLLDDMSVTVDETTYSSEDVTAGIKQGNKNYYDAGTANELTQAEMTEIVNYARSKGIEIVPHMNMPGHMDAILDAIEYVGISDAHFTGYTTSVRSLNLNNDAAVEFTHGLLEKYVAYFNSLDCKYFHIGADEFGNDAYNGNMGFPNMGDELYAKFADFVNEAADIVKDAGMTPRAWNDGISYTRYSSDFDTDIQITYWSSGWGGYDVSSASALRNNGHEMINTNGDYYFVLTSNGITNPSSSALDFDNNTFMGSTISDPVGAMFCIWCDVPDSATEQEIAESVRITLRKMAASMNNTTEYSEEVVSGGFDEDGTIAESRTWNEVSPEDNDTITVSGYDLTRVETIEVATENVPAIEKAGNIKAWDITPYVGADKYTEKGVVSLPVPAEWNTSRLTGFYMENGEAVFVEGTYAEGHYTFEMPHFSVAGIAEIEYDELIELNVGETKIVTDSTGNHESSYTGAGLDTNIATVEVKGSNAVTGTTVSTSKTTELENGATYVVRVYDTAYALSSDTGRGDWGTKTLAFQKNALTANTKHFWTVEATGSGYKLKNAAGYLNLGGDNNSAYLNSTGEVFTIKSTSTGWTIRNQSGKYINALGGLNTYYSAGGWTEGSTRFDFYKVIEATDASTNITFNGVMPGETSVTVGNTVYKIVVHGNIDITINYKDANGNVIKTEVVSVADNAATYPLSNFDHEGKFYTVGDSVLNIVAGTTSYDVNVTETEINLSVVEPLTIYYWITNQAVNINDRSTQSLAAVEVYSENGVNFAELVPASDNAENAKVLWKGWLLPAGFHQTASDGSAVSPDMCTDSAGKLIEKIRYWNGQWEYFNGIEWTTIKDTDQVNAYYIQQTEITEEVTTNVTDWGENYLDWKNKDGFHWFWNNYVENGSKFVFLDFAVVYEDGTQSPNTFPVDETWFFHFEDCSESNPRVLKPITFTETSEYEIWKVTVTDVTSGGYESADTFTSNYDNTTETIVWSEDMGGIPQLESLSYTANRSGKLIRIYVRAVEKEDSLTVVYYDEKFGDTLYTYKISVNSGIDFSNIDPTPGEYEGDSTRIDVTGTHIVNALGKEQYFQTDLTLVPEAVGKYNNDLYKYTGSEISEDGKTLYLYYNIVTTVLSPMFVVDYGRPFKFNLSQVVNDVNLVNEVSVVGNTRYGTLEYDTTRKMFTYTPTQVLQNIDVLTINIKFDSSSTFTTTNSGVMPASTVNYEEGFATLTGFTGENTDITKLTAQTTQIAGQSTDVYGYDAEIVKDTNTYALSTTKGDIATFTFTGRGVELYVNSKDASGNIAIQVRDSSNKLVKVLSVKTTSNSEITGEFSDTEQKGLIAASVMGLTYGQYTVKVTTTAPGTAGVYFDGFRVYGTLENHGNDYYVADDEAHPMFIELRDEVLTAVKAKNTDSIYKKADEIIEQVHSESGYLNGGLLLSNNENIDAKDLLDNGPKNELFLLPGDMVTFNLGSTNAQVGMKAISGAADYKISCGTGESKAGTISSNTDMFYEEGVTGAVTIENTSDDSILSITKLKLFGTAVADEDFSFEPLTEEQVTFALRHLVTVEEPEVPEVPLEPELVYADASLDISLTDINGAVLATTSLTANGIVGETAAFSATVIEESVASILPEGYELKDPSYTDTEVAYGEKAIISFVAEEIVDEEIDVIETIVKNVFNAVNNLFKKLFSWW